MIIVRAFPTARKEERKAHKMENEPLPKITFTKYQGTGNDFIMIDNMSGWFTPFSGNVHLIQSMCHRRTGIGSDGLMELRSHPDQTFEARFYNPDGSPATFCGNGGRCAVAFAHELGILQYNEANFVFSEKSYSGIFDQINDCVHLKVCNVDSIIKHDEANYYLNTGTSHHVRFTTVDLDACDIKPESAQIRAGDYYEKNGDTNVNFIQKKSENSCYLSVRTFEKGVEEETLACGSGSVAAALADAHVRGQTIACENSHCRLSHLTVQHRHVITRGGELVVTFDTTDFSSFSDIFLIGPAKRVYEGVFCSIGRI